MDDHVWHNLEVFSMVLITDYILYNWPMLQLFIYNMDQQISWWCLLEYICAAIQETLKDNGRRLGANQQYSQYVELMV